MKNKKLPKLFRKPLKEKKFRAKILRRIHVKKERDFLESLTKKTSDGKIALREELTKDEHARLKKLAKAIKKNKGLLVTWKLVILAVFFGATIIFNLLFKDMLLERGAEKQLQRLFAAKVDLVNPHLSLFGGTIAFERLVVADKDKPMENLFELGPSVFSIDIYQLLGKKVVIHKAEGQDIAFGTKRSSSGLLEPEDDEGLENEEKETKSAGKAEEALTVAGEIGLQSAEQLFETYKEQLNSPELISATNERLQTSIDRWNERIAQIDERVEEVEEAAGNVLDKDPRNFSTVEEARNYIETLNAQKKKIEEMRKAAGEIADAFSDDLSFVEGLDGEIREAIEDDIRGLTDAVGGFGADAKSAVSSSAEPLLRKAYGKTYDYAKKVLGTAEYLKGRSSEKKPKYAKDRRRRGTLVHFPTMQYPAFLLEDFHISFGDAHSAESKTDIRVRNIAFDPNEWDEPIHIEYHFRPEEKSLAVSAILDLRSSADTALAMDANLSGYPLQISNGLSSLTIENLQGTMENTFSLSLSSTTEGEGSAVLQIEDMNIDFTESSGPVSSAISEIVSDIDKALFAIEFGFENAGVDSFSVETDLDEALRERVGSYLQDLAEKTREKLEKQLMEYLQDSVKENEKLQQMVEEYTDSIDEQLADIRSLNNLIEEKKRKTESSIEEEINAAKKEAEEAVKKEAEKQVDKIKEGLGGLNF
jgi:uncharacterized protein (TIGR03545 family)